MRAGHHGSLQEDDQISGDGYSKKKGGRSVMALTALERRMVEMIRSAKKVTVCLDYGTKEELALTVGGRCPHDIAIAVQTLFNEESKNRKV